MRVAIIGAGDLGVQFQHLIQSNSKINVMGWFDDTKPRLSIFKGLQVLGGIDEVISYRDQFDAVSVAIGYKHLTYKTKLLEYLNKSNIQLFSFIHHSAIIDKTAILEDGCFVYPGVIIDMNCHIGQGVILNNSVTISHDSTIGNSSFVAPGAVICGKVNIGNACFVGAGATIIDNTNLCNHVVLGAGATLIQSLSKAGTYLGCPAELHSRK